MLMVSYFPIVVAEGEGEGGQEGVCMCVCVIWQEEWSCSMCDMQF